MGPWSPAGPNWQQAIRTDLVSAITAAEMQCDDPDKVASRWSEIIEIDRADVDGVPTIPLENADAALRADHRRPRRGPRPASTWRARTPTPCKAERRPSGAAGRRRPRRARRDALLPAVVSASAARGTRRRGNATSITTPRSRARRVATIQRRGTAPTGVAPPPASCSATATAMPIGRRQLEDRAAGGAGHRVEARRHPAHQRAGQRGEPADDAEAAEHHARQHRRRVRGVVIDEQHPPQRAERPPAMHPAATSSRWPMRSARRPANGDSTAPIAAAGARPKPACSGDQPHTSTKNDGISTSQPNVEPTNSRLGDVADGEAAQAEQVEVEQRRRVPRRAHDERRQQHRRHEERR